MGSSLAAGPRASRSRLNRLGREIRFWGYILRWFWFRDRDFRKSKPIRAMLRPGYWKKPGELQP